MKTNISELCILNFNISKFPARGWRHGKGGLEGGEGKQVYCTCFGCFREGRTGPINAAIQWCHLAAVYVAYMELY